MHTCSEYRYIYDDLDDDIKRAIKLRIFYMLGLIVSLIWSTFILIEGKYTDLTKCLEAINSISIVASMGHIWLMVYHNKINVPDTALIYAADFITNAVFFGFVSSYVIDMANHKPDLIQTEIIVVIMYAIIYYSILAVLGSICIFVMLKQCCMSTIENVINRHKEKIEGPARPESSTQLIIDTKSNIPVDVPTETNQ